MGVLLGKIVLTGGPCAGKTTALSKIEESLVDKGYKVFIVSESATEMIKGGIRPFGSQAVDIYQFQKLIMEYQLGKEKVYEKAVMSLPEDDKCVIIYDRGVIDNKAYIGQNKFSQLLKEMNLKQIELMDNYDMVIHLVTAADGKAEYYTLANNQARTETVEEAIDLDRRTLNAWSGHSNLKIIDNSTEFEEKLNKVMDCVYGRLGTPVFFRKQKKFTVDINNSSLEFLENEECIKIEIEQIYLDNPSMKDVYEERIRKRTFDGESTYYLTVQSKEKDGLSKVVTEKKISEKEYNKFKSRYAIKNIVHKTRYNFTRDKQYYRLDLFKDSDLAILEVEPSKENEKITFPKELKILKEVTDDPDYQNIKITNQKAKQLKKEKKD